MKSYLYAAVITVLTATTAQAVETGALTLACKGTAVAGYEDAKPEPFSMSLIVSFTAGTVFGTPGFSDLQLRSQA